MRLVPYAPFWTACREVDAYRYLPTWLDDAALVQHHLNGRFTFEMDTHDGSLPACHRISPMTTPTPIPTAVQRLIAELTAFAGQVDQFLEASTIDFKQQDTRGGLFMVGWHDYQWGVLDDHGRRLQRVLLEAWPPLMERVQLLLAADPSPVQKRLDKLNQFVTGWLDRPGTFDSTIPATIPEAKKRFHEGFTPCLDLLGSLGQQTGATIVVPDTNVLVRSPEIGRYRQVLGADDYTVVLVAPVLAELDALKTGRASPSVRDKARGFGNRIKEWRRRGPLHLGVTVEGKVIVRAEGREPNLQASLSWLDPTVVDDRIVACTLELQRRHPSDRVVLLTGDVNLLAKADMAGIPTADTPDPDPE